MKQANELTAAPLFTDAFSWSTKTRSARFSFSNLRQQIAEQISQYRQLFFSIAAVILIGGLFVAGSYLFLTQLAKFGW